MGGTETTRGIGYQNAYSVWRVLELLDESKRVTSVTVEGKGKDIEDLVVTYSDGSEEIVQVKTREKEYGSAGQWSRGEIEELMLALYKAGGEGRKVAAFRLVSTGNVPKGVTEISEACGCLRKKEETRKANADAIADMCGVLGVCDEAAREFMSRLWIDIPHESEGHVKSETQLALMKRHGVSAESVDVLYGYLYEQVLERAKKKDDRQRTIRSEDLLGWIGGKRWRDREELLKELSVTDPALARSVTYAEERRSEFTGREWVFAKIDEWLADENAPRFFLITGEPGIGKTAIAAELTHRREVAAEHFCVAGDAVTTEPSVFTRAIARQLAEIEGFTECVLREREAKVERGASFNEFVAMPLTRLYAGGYQKPILIVVDALDEAARRLPQETIIDILVGIAGLPQQVRFVLTSRPEGAVRMRFDESETPYLLLEAESEENLRDVKEYIQGRIGCSPELHERLRDQTVEESEFVKKVGRASAGNFLYVVMLLREIENGTRRADAPGELPERLEGVFREYLMRRGLDRDRTARRERYLPVMGILAVAREPLSEGQVADFTGLGEETVDGVLEDIEQFLKPALTGERLYQLYHQSLVDYLVDRWRAGVFAVNASAAHERIADFYLAHFRDDWSSCDDYGLRHLSAHVADTGRKKDLRSLLFEYGWIEAKLARTDASAVIADYDLAGDDDEARLLQRALRMSAHVLARERGALAAQLYGRLMSFDSDETASVAAFLQSVIDAQTVPWLRCVTRSLRSAGDPLIRTMEGHKGPVTAVSVYNDDRKAISGSEDGTLRIWDLATGKQVGRPLEGHMGHITAVSVYDNGAKAISASVDNTLRIWDLATGRQVGEPLEGHAWPVNAVTVYENGAKAISASVDNTLRIWDLATGRQVGEPLEGHTGYITAVRVYENGAKAISASWDKTLRIWDLATGEQIGEQLEGHTDWVRAVSLFENETKAISASRDKTLRIWYLATGKQVGEPLAGHTSAVTTVSVHQSGAKAISASEDKTLRIWDLATGKQVGKPFEGHTGHVRAVSVYENGAKAISVSNDGTLRVWDLAMAREAGGTLEGHAGYVTAVSIYQDGAGAKAISASADSTLRIWDLKTGKQLGEPLEGHMGHVRAVSVYKNGTKAISASSDKTLRTWDLATGRQIGKPLEGHADCVNGVSVYNNGARAISASYDGTLRIWDLKTGKQVGKPLEGHANWVSAVSAYDNGAKAVSASWDKTLRIWDLETGGQVGKPLEGHTWHVIAVSVYGNGTKAISASDDKSLRLWDLATGSQVGKPLEGHTNWVNAVCACENGAKAISGSEDGTIRVWRVDAREVLTVFVADAPVTACAITPDGRTIVAGDSTGRIHILRLEDPIRQAED